MAEYRKINGALFGRQVSEGILDAATAARRRRCLETPINLREKKKGRRQWVDD